MCKYLTNVFAEWNLTFVIIAYFIICFAGIAISAKSDNAIVSFLGYNMVVVPVGVILSLALKEYDNGSIMHAIIITGGVTFMMVVLSTIFPRIFLSMGKALLIALLCVIIAEVIFIFTGFGTPAIWDMAIALIFALYIGYDWAKAQEEEHTFDNAVDACVGLYLDIINLLLRVLGSSSKSKQK